MCWNTTQISTWFQIGLRINAYSFSLNFLSDLGRHRGYPWEEAWAGKGLSAQPHTGLPCSILSAGRSHTKGTIIIWHQVLRHLIIYWSLDLSIGTMKITSSLLVGTITKSWQHFLMRSEQVHATGIKIKFPSALVSMCIIPRFQSGLE